MAAAPDVVLCACQVGILALCALWLAFNLVLTCFSLRRIKQRRQGTAGPAMAARIIQLLPVLFLSSFENSGVRAEYLKPQADTDVILQDGSSNQLVRSVFKKLGLCEVLRDLHPEFCHDRTRRTLGDNSSSVFQIIVDETEINGSSATEATRTLLPWRFNRVLLKGNQSHTSKKPTFESNGMTSIDIAETLVPPSLGIKIGDVTYPLTDPTLPWRVLVYFAGIQIEVSTIQDVEKRRSFSDYLFRKMNVYLYSIGGSDFIIKLPSQSAASPKSFMGITTKLAHVLVFMMCALLVWFVGYLSYYWCWVGHSISRISRRRSDTAGEALPQTSSTGRRSLRKALEELSAQSECSKQ